MRLVIFLMTASLALAEPPADVLKFFRSVTETLANDDWRGFMGKFDRSMPGYATLQAEIEGLTAGQEIGSTIEVVNDEGDNQKRTLELDWLLLINDKGDAAAGQGSRRQIVKCTIERRGKQWKITALDPIEFFK
jgi:hypothetical protein